jgi:UDP-3-O-[3-hydroxymyristoyl] glucosamine N-acyltransferase
VTIRERSRLGLRVTIHSGTVIGSDGFGYELQQGRHVKVPQIGYVQIDDDVEVGANVAIDRGRFDRTWIQEGTKIDNLVQIAHNVTIGKHSIIIALSGIAGSTTLGQYVTLAGQSGIAGHLHIGDQVIIGAHTAVAKDAPAKIILSGRHAKPLRESLKIEALTNRLPELVERIKQLEAKLEALEKA